jgi:hypothetical protein
MIGKQKPQKQAKEAPVISINFSLLLKRRALIAASSLALLTAAQPALAQEAEPGDTCVGLAAGTVRQSSGPEISGGHVLYCDGANWISVLSYDTDAHLTTLGDQNCVAGEVLSYNGTYWACTAASSLSGLWEDAGTVIRPSSGIVDYASDDFVFGAPDFSTANADHYQRLFFDKSKGAFGVGHFDAVAAPGNIGSNSVAFGYRANASGPRSFAAGATVTASDDYAFAQGLRATASGTSSFARGTDVIASGGYSAVIGLNSTASGARGYALGSDLIASGAGSFAIGSRVIAGSGTAGDGSGDRSIAFGLQTATPATSPTITGDRSAVFFFDGHTTNANSGYNFTQSDKLALVGGELQIGETQAQGAAKGCLRFDPITNKLQFAHDCASYTELGDVSGSALWQEGAGDIVYYNSGTPMVGIGTNSPTHALEVTGDMFLGATGSKGKITFAGSARNSIGSKGTQDVTIAARQNLIFETDLNTEMMRINQSGNVGIGDPSPNSGTGGQLKLDVEGPVGATHYCDENGSNCFSAAEASGLWQKGAGGIIYYNSGTPQVGIGTASPQATVDIRAAAAGKNVLFNLSGGDISSFSTGSGGEVMILGADISVHGVAGGSTAGQAYTDILRGSIFMTTGGGGNSLTLSSGSILAGSGSAAFTIDTQGSANTAITILKAGDLVGINNTVPDVTLDVGGDIDYTGVIRDVSDERLKSNIERLSPASSAAIGQLKPVSFTMKDGDGSVEMGFIAQDVEKVLPELVRTGSDGMKSLNYVGLIAPLTAAVQELRQENDDLRLRVERLEAASTTSVND